MPDSSKATTPPHNSKAVEASRKHRLQYLMNRRHPLFFDLAKVGELKVSLRKNSTTENRVIEKTIHEWSQELHDAKLEKEADGGLLERWACRVGDNLYSPGPGNSLAQQMWQALILVKETTHSWISGAFYYVDESSSMTEPYSSWRFFVAHKKDIVVECLAFSGSPYGETVWDYFSEPNDEWTWSNQFESEAAVARWSYNKYGIETFDGQLKVLEQDEIIDGDDDRPYNPFWSMSPERRLSLVMIGQFRSLKTILWLIFIAMVVLIFKH